MSLKTKLLATGVAAILGSALMVTTTAAPSMALPINAVAPQVAPVANSDLVDVQYRRRGPGHWRHHRGNPGGAIAAGVALGILGTAIIANQRRYEDPYYYDDPPPARYYEEAPPAYYEAPRRRRGCYVPDNNGRTVWTPC